MGERTRGVRMSSGTDCDKGCAVEPVRSVAEGRSSEEIAADIDQTRAEMTETVDALQKKLAPDRLVDDFLNAVRDSLERNSDRVLDTMRQHPVVTSLVGLGVGWLLLESKEGNTTKLRDLPAGNYPSYGDYVEYPEEEYRSVGESMDEKGANFKENLKATAATARQKVGQMASGAREQASYLAAEATGYAREQAGYMASRAREQAGHIAGRAREHASDLAAEAAGYAREQAGYAASRGREQAAYIAGRAREQFGHLGTAAAGQARQAAHRVGDLVHENPFAAAAVGVAMGAAIGLLIPETRREEELMGEARDTVFEKAKATASDTIDRVKRVAEAAKDAAVEEADKQNLSAEGLSRQVGMAAEFGKGLIDKVEGTVTSAASVAREEAKRQGLSSEIESGKGSGDMPGAASASEPVARAAKDDVRREGCGE